jgi:sec-independent protein translocase protein TatA
MIGPMEVGIVMFLALLIFGPRQLPKLGRSLGESIREFRGIGRAITEESDKKEED